MRRLALGLAAGLLALAGAAAWTYWPRQDKPPAWFKVGSAPALTLHMDRNSMEQVDDNVWRAGELQDLQAADPQGVRSRRYVAEYDCEHKMHRIGEMASYSGPMLTGSKLFEVDEFGYWRPVPPGSLFALAYVIHCGK